MRYEHNIETGETKVIPEAGNEQLPILLFVDDPGKEGRAKEILEKMTKEERKALYDSIINPNNDQ